MAKAKVSHAVIEGVNVGGADDADDSLVEVVLRFSKVVGPGDQDAAWLHRCLVVASPCQLRTSHRASRMCGRVLPHAPTTRPRHL